MIRFNLSAVARLLIAGAAALALLTLVLSPLLAADAGRPELLAAAGGAGERPVDDTDPQAPPARPAGQGVDLEIRKFVQSDTPPFDGTVIYNGDHITYTITVRNLTGSPILVTRVRDELAPGTLFGVECDQAGDPPCSLEVTTQTVSIPSTQKGVNLPPLPPVITTTNAVVWSNFNIAPGETKTLVFSAIVDCLPAGALLRNVAGVTFGGSFLVSNETVTTVELRPAVINANGKPLLTGPSGCSIEVGGYDQDWGDFDQDGDLDLALATNNRSVVYRNFNGQMVQMASHDQRSFGVRWADIDGDGKLELISVGDSNTRTNGFVEGKNYIFDNEIFYSPDQTFTTPDVLWRIDVADYDGDGDLDLAGASYIDPAARPRHNPCLLRLYNNDGSGSLAPEECMIGPLSKDSTWQPAITQRSYSVAWADVDRDGDQDLGVGDYGTHNRAHLNTGTELGAPSSFIENTTLAPEDTTSLAWADFDNDGDPDPAWGNQNQRARLYRNNGLPTSTWTEAWQAPNNRATTSVAWGGRPDRDASIPIRDDAALEYSLPFVFPFGQSPRSIIKISVNTNGMVELLQAGETCRACGSWFNTHASGIHSSQNIDAIFAASADLYSGVLIEAVPEDNPTRVEINWLGASYSDTFRQAGLSSGFELSPMLFKVILHSSGRIEWRVFNYNYFYAYDNFAGVYDEVADREIPVELNAGFIPGGTAARSFLFDPADAARDWDEPVVRTATWPGDRSIPTTDDGALTTPYVLPFTTPITFYDRAITQICVNTNGLIELLEAGESCQKGGAAYTHRSGDYTTIDAVFAANDNLRTGVFVEGNAERVAITWLGASNYDTYYWYTFYNISSYKTNQLAFKVILYADGRIWWKFFDMNYTNYNDPTYGLADFYSGVYRQGQPAPVEVPGGSKSFVGYDLRRRFQFFRNPPIVPVEREFALALGNYGQRNEVYRVAGNALPAAPSWTSGDTRNTTGLAWLDYNGDGFLDLAAGNFNQETVLYRASGPAALDTTPVSLVAAAKPVRSIAWADLDADGDLDLALGNEGQPIEVYRNQISPNDDYPYQPSMALAWSAPVAHTTQSVAWADVDGDNFPDLAVGSLDTALQLYQNDGGQMENTPLWTSLEISQTRQIAWGDVDNDGDLDLAVANDNQRNTLYLNRRYFVTGNERRALGSVNDLAWGDYDNDGFPDLAIGGVDLETPGGGFVYLVKNNAGRLLFTRSGTQQVENGFPAELFDLAWGDYNRDGFLDLAATYPVEQEIRFYLNPGAGGGAWTAPQVLNGLVSYAIDWVDLQQDGWLDLAVADSPGTTAPQLKIYRNQADRVGASNFRFNDFVTPDADLGQGAVFSLRGVDRDNDGDIDLGAVNLGRQSQLFTAFGSFLNPRLAAVDGAQLGNFSARSVAWGDYNGDGRLDLLFGGWDIASRLYRNQGGAGFCLAGSSPVTCPAGPNFDLGGQRVAIFGDFDGDNRLDIADGVPGGQVKLYRSGLSTSQSINLVEAYAMAWGDADGDGRLDLLVGGKDTAARQTYVYFNRRVEPFLDSSSPRWALPSLEQTISLAWADYDNDNHLDFVVGNCNTDGSRSVQLYRNNRDNTFSLVGGSGLPESGYCTRSLAWADFDGDGDPDLAAGNDNAPTFIYRNQGLYGGTFSAVWNTGNNASTRSVAWGDWNNDGKPELALGNYGQPDRVYGNFSTPAATVLIWLWTSDQAYQTTGLAWGDKDGDGDLDLAFSQNQSTAPNGIYENGYVSPTHLGPRYASLPRNPSYLSVHRPGASDAYLISARALTGARIPINYTVYDAAGDNIITSPTSLYRFEYAVNGGDTWRTATLSGTASHTGDALPNGQPATVTWNAAADGVVGDSVRFRISVVHDKPAGPVQYATTRATSPPFRIRSLTCQWPADPTITTRVSGQITTTIMANQVMIFNGGLSAGTGVMTFTWNLGDVLITGQGNIPYSYTVAGTYPVTLTVVGEPCPTSREVMTRTLVTVLPAIDPQGTIYLPLLVKPGTGATVTFDPSVPRPGQVRGFSGRVEAAGTELSWTASPLADAAREYRLYRSPRLGPAEFSLLGTVPVSTTAYIDAAANCGYMYYVTAVNAGGESLPSTSSYISRPCD